MATTILSMTLLFFGSVFIRLISTVEQIETPHYIVLIVLGSLMLMILNCIYRLNKKEA